MSFRQLKYTTNKLLAGFMAFWLTGVVFLFCCEQINSAAKDAEFCPLAKISAHCDKSGGGETSNVSVSDGDLAMDCCEFLPAVFSKARKLEQVQKLGLPALSAQVVNPRRIALIDETPVPPVLPSHISDHHKLFIRNCAIRI